jgi:multisubunit Na+/H+ antiporter MnhF subunit
VVLAIVLGARTALEIAAVLMLVGLLSTVACNITRG